MFKTVTVAPGTAAPVVSVTVPLMSPWFTACPRAAANDPAKRTPTSNVNRPGFIPASKELLQLCIVLVPVHRLPRANSIRQTVVYRHLGAREQYNRKPHKVVKDYLVPVKSLSI